MPMTDNRTPNFSFPLTDAGNALGDDQARINEALTIIDTRFQEIVNQTQSPDAGTLGGQDLAFILSLANATGILPLTKGGTGGSDAASARAALGFDGAWDAKFAAALSVAPEHLNTILEIVAEIQDNDSAIAAINTVLASKAAQTALDALDAAKAPLASPELTGTPTSPTPDGSNDQQIANVAYVAANGSAVSKLDLLLMQMQISDGVSKRVGFAGSYADDLEQGTSFNAAASDDATFASSSIQVDEADDALPVFATFTSGSFTVSANTTYGGYPAWQAVDTFSTSYWIPANTGIAWWRVDCGSATPVAVIKVTTNATGSGHWVFQGSDSPDSGYVDLATKPDSGSGEYSVTLAAPVNYRYYRLSFPSAVSGSTTLGNVSLLSSVRQQDARIVIEEYDVGATPSSLYVLLACTIGGTPTLNTDIIASLSRDDGTTWTAGTLSQIGATSDGVVYLEAEVDVSAQPVGQLASLKIETANFADLVLEGLVMRWS